VQKKFQKEGVKFEALISVLNNSLNGIRIYCRDHQDVIERCFVRTGYLFADMSATYNCASNMSKVLIYL
jgi:hypothetical protein